MKHSHLIIFAALLFYACKNQSTPTNTNETEVIPEQSSDDLQMVIITKRSQWSEGDCDTPDGACLKIDLKYPLTANGKPAIREKINENITDYVISTFELEESEQVVESVDEAAQLFIESFKEIKNDMPGRSYDWAIELDGKQSIINNHLVIQLVSFTNLGGAHPNVYLSFTNIDLSTGEEFFLDDIITDKKAFNQLAEKEFYAARGAKKGDSDFSDAFWGKPFYLPENFAVTTKGIKLFYNNYEVLAYVYGQTEYTLPYSKVKDMIQLP